MEEPGIATANTGDLFKVIQTEHQAYIGSINKPVGLFDVIGEVQSVPIDTPRVANKYTIPVLDFGKRINYMSQVAVRLLSKLNKFGGSPAYRTIPSQAFA